MLVLTRRPGETIVIKPRWRVATLPGNYPAVASARAGGCLGEEALLSRPDRS